MLKEEFVESLKSYKKLKTFLEEEFGLEPLDSFDISGGTFSVIKKNFGEYYEEEIPLTKIVAKLEEDIKF